MTTAIVVAAIILVFGFRRTLRWACRLIVAVLVTVALVVVSAAYAGDIESSSAAVIDQSPRVA